MNSAAIAILAAWLVAGSPPAGNSGAVAPPKDDTPAKEPAPKPDATPAASGPSLDELLGLEKSGGAAAQTARDNEQELERRLSEETLGDVLDVALARMEESADLLDVRFDPGLGTQRVQRDILAKLDELLDKAKQMASKQPLPQGGGGGQSSSPQQSPGSQPHRSQRGQRTNGQQQQGQATEPPPGQTGDINTIIEQTEQEWGHLPPRIRELLEQGQNGQSSRRYRRLTEEYFRRLAEEGS